MTSLIRKNYRLHLVKTDLYKKISKLNFFNSEAIEYRKLRLQEGIEKYKKNIEEVKNKLNESIGLRLNKIVELLKLKNLSQSKIDEFVNKWMILNSWPKPKNYRILKKEFKKLCKKYKI